MDFTESELFKNLLETKDKSFHVDLHNDFTCVQLIYLNGALDLKFQDDQGQGYITVLFSDAIIIRLEIPLKKLTIDNFHRGRYEINGKLYDEYQGKKCFYIEFYEGGSIELLCTKATVQVTNSALN